MHAGLGSLLLKVPKDSLYLPKPSTVNPELGEMVQLSSEEKSKFLQSCIGLSKILYFHESLTGHGYILLSLGKC